MYRQLIIAAVVLVALCNSARSQEGKYWVTVGGGFSFAEGYFGSALGLAATYKPSMWLFSSRYMSANRVKGTFDFNAIPLDHLQDFSMLAGASREDENTVLSFALGPGLVKGTFDEDQTHRNFSTVGLSLEGQAILKLGRSIGIGAYSYANINEKATYVGIWLSLQVGRFRNW